MKKISLLLSSLFVGSLALAQTTTLYYVWENAWVDNELDNLESWSTSSEEKIKPTVLWDNNTAIEVDFANGTFFSRLNIPSAIPFDVYSFNSSVGIDFWVRNSISTVGDFNVSTAVHDGGYDPISGNDGKQKQLRFALSKNDFLTVGGKNHGHQQEHTKAHQQPLPGQGQHGKESVHSLAQLTEHSFQPAEEAHCQLHFSRSDGGG